MFVSKTLGISNKRLEDLTQDIPNISQKKAQDVARYIKERIDLRQNRNDSLERE